MMESIMGRVTVQVQGVQNVLHHVSLLVLEDVVGKYPGKGHLNGELTSGWGEEEDRIRGRGGGKAEEGQLT